MSSLWTLPCVRAALVFVTHTLYVLFAVPLLSCPLKGNFGIVGSAKLPFVEGECEKHLSLFKGCFCLIELFWRSYNGTAHVPSCCPVISIILNLWFHPKGNLNNLCQLDNSIVYYINRPSLFKGILHLKIQSTPWFILPRAILNVYDFRISDKSNRSYIKNVLALPSFIMAVNGGRDLGGQERSPEANQCVRVRKKIHI